MYLDNIIDQAIKESIDETKINCLEDRNRLKNTTKKNLLK